MPTVVFDDVPSGSCKIFDAPIDTIRADDSGDVEAALSRMQDRIDAGYYLAGYFSYELGYIFENRLTVRLPFGRATPLLWFGVFEGPPQRLTDTAFEQAWQQYRGYAGSVRLEWDEATYAAKFAEVAQCIVSGDIYQANLSMRGNFVVVGNPRGLYRAIRKQGGGAYSTYIDDGTRKVLSFSPELFFEVTAEGTITCKPMKGTAPRVACDAASDVAARISLHTSPKNRAENLMIVDLVRNDLGRIAATGSVNVTELFKIESYPTVHQMVSTVSAKLKRDTSVRRLLEAIFPCGSVTGAPKIRAMEIIRELETSPRGVYCGAIGWFAPDRSARLNVAIRTLTVADGRGELGIGGGLVSDSQISDEYAECQLKARYFEVARKPLKFIETLRYEAGSYVRLKYHLQRLEASARVFQFPFDRDRVLLALAEPHCGTPPLRVRLTLDERGRIEVTSSQLTPMTVWRYIVSRKRIDSHDALLRYKTDWRDLYDAEREWAACEFGCDEVVFCNERGELCEGSRSNLFISIGGDLLTPAATSGLLEGCLRRELLDSACCREAVLRLFDLAEADQVYFGNSLRDLVPAVPAAAHSLSSTPAAGIRPTNLAR